MKDQTGKMENIANPLIKKVAEWYAREYSAIRLRLDREGKIHFTILRETDKAVLAEVQPCGHGIMAATSKMECWIPKSVLEV